jgi:hypothetical protein
MFVLRAAEWSAPQDADWEDMLATEVDLKMIYRARLRKVVSQQCCAT